MNIPTIRARYTSLHLIGKILQSITASVEDDSPFLFKRDNF